MSSRIAKNRKTKGKKSSGKKKRVAYGNSKKSDGAVGGYG